MSSKPLYVKTFIIDKFEMFFYVHSNKYSTIPFNILTCPKIISIEIVKANI